MPPPPPPPTYTGLKFWSSWLTEARLKKWNAERQSLKLFQITQDEGAKFLNGLEKLQSRLGREVLMEFKDWLE